MGMRVGGVEMVRYGADTVCVLGNNIMDGSGGVGNVSVMLRGADIIREDGVLPDGRVVSLVNALPTDEETVKAIRTERDHWGRGMGDAFVGPVQNRVQATNVSGNKGHIIFDGVDQVVPVDEHGVMLHSEGFGMSDLEYKVAGPLVWDPSRNFARITGIAVLNGWFSPLRITQSIILQGGVTTRYVTVENIGDHRAPWSCTTHRYSRFPSESEQPRDGILMDIPAHSIMRTMTEPFVKGETLLPDLAKDPFYSVIDTPFKKLFDGPADKRTLKNVYLDHCFTELKHEKVEGDPGSSQFTARLRYPKAGYGVEVSVPFDNAQPDPVNALQVYTPPMPAAAYGTAAFEFAACVTDPFNPGWRRNPVVGMPLYTSSGLRILHPGNQGKASSYTYTVVHRMIDLAGAGGSSGKGRAVVAIDGLKGTAADPSSMKGKVGKKVKQILIECLALDAVQVKKMGRSWSVMKDLGADSLDEAELVQYFKEEFKIEVDDTVEFTTVGDIIDFINKALAEKARKKGK